MENRVNKRYNKYIEKKEDLIELEKNLKEEMNQAKTVEEYRKLKEKRICVRQKIIVITNKIKKLRKQYEIPKEDNLGDGLNY